MDNGELSEDIESFPADQVELSLGHLSLDEFITYILVTLSAWVQWGWLYYKGDGTVSVGDMATRHLRPGALRIADKTSPSRWLHDRLPNSHVYGAVSKILGTTHPASMRVLANTAKIGSKLSTSRGTKRRRGPATTRRTTRRTLRSRTSRGGKVSTRKKRTRAKKRPRRRRIKSC